MKLDLCFYFQVHQPYRLKHMNVLDIGNKTNYFDDALNRLVMEKVAKNCYLPMNNLLLTLAKRYGKDFKIAFAVTGTAIDQFKQYAPAVLDSFKALNETGCVEWIGETYFHSLSFLYDTNEFLDQVNLHRELMEQEFGYSPVTFRNTELIYQDRLSDLIYEVPGYKTILTEGVDRILKWRSPLYGYKNYTKTMNLLLKFYRLSDDIAFRFSNRSWPEWPLTVEKFVDWTSQLTLEEKKDRNLQLNLFMDYETFGEHQWEESGIFDFMEHLPAEILKRENMGFCWPRDIESLANYQQEALSFPEAVSWADEQRDLTAWLENDMQKNAIETLYELLPRVKAIGDPQFLGEVRKLTTSDHFYYMCTKYFNDGDVHKYFSPYDSPDQAYIYFMNAMADLEERLS